MSSEYRLILIDKNNDVYILKRCVSFTVEYELYTPYSQLRASFISEKSIADKLTMINRLFLYVNGVYVHFGFTDSLTLTASGSEKILNVQSRSFTLLLGQNQPKPGINSGVDLTSLIKKNLKSTFVLTEKDTPQVNYIYVKENSTLWDAVTAYSLKANGFYPYIRGNTICITLNLTENIRIDTNFIERGESTDTVNMLSEIYMKDVDDNYSFHKVNSKAADYNIERVRYYPLDRQWLSDSDIGLNGKINYSNRKISSSFFSYKGYNGERLMDTLSCPDSGLNGKRISRVIISAGKNQLITKIWCYNDYLSQRK